MPLLHEYIVLDGAAKISPSLRTFSLSDESALFTDYTNLSTKSLLLHLHGSETPNRMRDSSKISLSAFRRFTNLRILEFTSFAPVAFTNWVLEEMTRSMCNLRFVSWKCNLLPPVQFLGYLKDLEVLSLRCASQRSYATLLSCTFPKLHTIEVLFIEISADYYEPIKWISRCNVPRLRSMTAHLPSVWPWPEEISRIYSYFQSFASSLTSLDLKQPGSEVSVTIDIDQILALCKNLQDVCIHFRSLQQLSKLHMCLKRIGIYTGLSAVFVGPPDAMNLMSSLEICLAVITKVAITGTMKTFHLSDIDYRRFMSIDWPPPSLAMWGQFTHSLEAAGVAWELSDGILVRKAVDEKARAFGLENTFEEVSG
jgi:hypothetical protein